MACFVAFFHRGNHTRGCVKASGFIWGQDVSRIHSEFLSASKPLDASHTWKKHKGKVGWWCYL